MVLETAHKEDKMQVIAGKPALEGVDLYHVIIGLELAHDKVKAQLDGTADIPAITRVKSETTAYGRLIENLVSTMDPMDRANLPARIVDKLDWHGEVVRFDR